MTNLYYRGLSWVLRGSLGSTGFYTVQFYRVQFSRVQFSRVQFSRVQFSRVQFSKVLNGSVLQVLQVLKVLGRPEP